jgi:uncharacterized membrane protein
MNVEGKCMTSLPSIYRRVDNAQANADRNSRFSQKRLMQTERWLSIFGGGILTAYGLWRFDWFGALLSVIGGSLMYRGATRRFLLSNQSMSPSHATNVTPIPDGKGIRIQRSLTINRAPDEVYTFWSDVENAPLYVPNVISASKTGERTAHWVAHKKKHAQKSIEWDTEVLEDHPGALIAWRASGHPLGATAGKVQFRYATGRRGTVVTLALDFVKPDVLYNSVISKVSAPLAEHETLEILRRFKEMMEAGEIPTLKGQPTGFGRK